MLVLIRLFMAAAVAILLAACGGGSSGSSNAEDSSSSGGSQAETAMQVLSSGMYYIDSTTDNNLLTLVRGHIKAINGFINTEAATFSNNIWSTDEEETEYSVVLGTNGWVIDSSPCAVSESGNDVVSACTGETETVSISPVALNGRLLNSELTSILLDSASLSSSNTEIVNSILSSTFGTGDKAYQTTIVRSESVYTDCSVALDAPVNQWNCSTPVANDLEGLFGGTIVSVGTKSITLSGGVTDASGDILDTSNQNSILSTWTKKVVHGKTIIVLGMKPDDADEDFIAFSNIDDIGVLEVYYTPENPKEIIRNYNKNAMDTITAAILDKLPIATQ
ncbi:hypothetical protein [Marinomonas mediterranea]|uniref:hypothetical protein n=1 Tax=Marinomonas mediterranea TaxID=119864 RepID=UPI00234B10AD|nr:hypothetical protein [Marinomonas mediterranea]WCN07416.1 hypothetical protein GV055_00025 [Marinomonas mediterranea]